MGAMGRGFTLVEVILAAALVAASILLMVGMLPTGVLALKKAEDLQAATAYGVEVLEARSAALPSAPYAGAFSITLNGTRFRVETDLTAVPHPSGHLYDLAVTLRWNHQPAPVRLATRLYRLPSR